MKSSIQFSEAQRNELLETLQARFEKNKNRHKNISWPVVHEMLKAQPDKLIAIHKMEISGGEPDLISSKNICSGQLVYIDCSVESPAGRRSLCYDGPAWQERKEARPKGNAVDTAAGMNIELLTEDEYCALQNIVKLDMKTSSWIQTPESIRKLGGALFCDRRYDTVFTYHNGAQSYYAARGFRGLVRIEEKK